MTGEAARDPELLLGEIVLTAAGLTGSGREAYLLRVARKHGELARRARERLAAAEGASDSFLETPAAERLAAAEERPEPAPGALPAAERYELAEPLGEGGMGRVVLAFDRQLGRRVALKLLHRNEPEIARLFLSEARAQARVEHQNVLEIYDSGEFHGEPYLSMRYIAGGTLDAVAPTLSLETLVRLLAQVAEGLHAAHREGLLHGDVKPSNVLIERTSDGEPRALVTDFGLATELHGAENPFTRAVAGSPHYIAPERLAVDPMEPVAIDRRSDVYSLGITLYRLFTGALPFGEHRTMEVLRRTRREAPPPPRAVRPGLPAELEAIVLRCIARDPDRRYPSARAVAEDLRRYLDGEVVEAYAASLAYRLTRFVLRNRLLVGLAAVLAVVVVAASIAVTVFAFRADADRERAELRQGQAEELLRFVVVELRDDLEPLGRLDLLDAVGDEARDYFAAVPATELSDAELLRRSQMLHQIGDVRIRQGDLDGAAAPMEESLALARRLSDLRPEDAERLYALGQSEFWVGFVHWKRGDLDAARPPFERYLEISRRLVERDPASLDWRRELSYAHSNLGSLLQAEGDPRGALGQFRATLAIDRRLAAALPAGSEDRTEALSELAASHNTMGVALQDLGRLREAEEHLRADLVIRRRLHETGPDDVRTRARLAASHGHLGLHLTLTGDWTAAEDQFEAQRAILAGLVRHDAANAGWRYHLAWSHMGLGKVAFATGDVDAAERHWRVARQAIDDLLALDPAPRAWRRSRAVGLFRRALVEAASGEPGARRTTGEAIALFEELSAESPADRDMERWLGTSLLLSGGLDDGSREAPSTFRRAAETIAPSARTSRDGRLLAPWALALTCLGRADEGRAILEDLGERGYAEVGVLPLTASPPMPGGFPCPGRFEDPPVSPVAAGSR